MGLLEWSLVNTPDCDPGVIREILNPYNRGASVIKLLAGAIGNTMWTIIRRGDRNGINDGGAQTVLYKSTDCGISWDDSQYGNLFRLQSNIHNGSLIWDVAIPPDNPNILAVACSDINNNVLSQEVWISQDGGQNWHNTQWSASSTEALISVIDISVDISGERYVLVGTRTGDGNATHNVQTLKISDKEGWKIQDEAHSSTNEFAGDVITAKFSPTFIVDRTIVVVYSDSNATKLLTGSLNTWGNGINWNGVKVELKNLSAVEAKSPNARQIWNASIALPSNFSGKVDMRSRIYVSISAESSAGLNHGVYRVDDKNVHTLMDNSNTAQKAIGSISYWGVCSKGKLLAGEIYGNSSKASVPVWFTMNPESIDNNVAWFPSHKQPSGAANSFNRNDSKKYKVGFGNANVVWAPVNAYLGVAYCVTGSACPGPWKKPNITRGAIESDLSWPAGRMNVVPLDESAFSMTFNNNSTWNQLSLINTVMSKLTDVAISPDCTTMYLSSVNVAEGHNGFDSVWRSTSNEKVIGPILPSLPVGSIWQRVRVSPTSIENNLPQSKWAILRLSQDKNNGQIILWAAGGTSGQSSIGKCPVGQNTNAVAWSPDFGDYWADIRTELNVQDLAVPSSMLFYVIDTNGNLEKLTYAGPAGFINSAVIHTHLKGTHIVEARGANDVLVSGDSRSPQAVAYSSDGGINFTAFTGNFPSKPGIGFHAIFDASFNTTKTIFVAGDGINNHIMRTRIDTMMTPFSNITGRNKEEQAGYFGLIQTNPKNVNQQGTLYSLYTLSSFDSGIIRTLRPLDGFPIPGIDWNYFCAQSSLQSQNDRIKFSLEPKSLKMCGCFTEDTNVTLYAIDNDWYSNNCNAAFNLKGITEVGERGMVWMYTDCLSKKGPKLISQGNNVIGYNQLSGFNQEIDFKWEPLAIASKYQIQLGKDRSMERVIADTGEFIPASLTSPSLFYYPGGTATFPETVKVPNLTPNNYYWRCRATAAITGEKIYSPWSDVLGMIVKELEIPANSNVRARDQSDYDFYLNGFITRNYSNQPKLSTFLSHLDPNLERKRLGAWQTLQGNSLDRYSQATSSMREVLTLFLRTLSPDEEVRRSSWYVTPKKEGSPITRRMRLQYALGGSGKVSSSTLDNADKLAEAVEATYSKLSAETHRQDLGGYSKVVSYLKACESLIEL